MTLHKDNTHHAVPAPAAKIAVALEYGLRATPVVTARGTHELAARIIDEAQANGVFIAQDPALVALLSQLEVEEPIPRSVYGAVAVVLSWAYWLKGMQPGDEKVPREPV